ncbi:MAG TPA: tetratricopeptide repeat protein [Candidatus Stackebrandtia excrementipullorum]|nr:tetratricopeptide repeat protein [Candidatus Stackebrandtia excrementipullorum]
MPVSQDIRSIGTKPELGAWLRSRFDALGLRVEDVANELAEVSKATIYNWLNGRNIPKPPKGNATDRFYLLLSHPDLGLTRAERLALDGIRERLTSDVERHRPMRGLPADIASFSGRDVELRRLDRLMSGTRRGNTVVVSAVSGIGGIGKTALAVRWAHRKAAADRFVDGCLYIDLHGFSTFSPLSTRRAMHRLLVKLGVKPASIPDDDDLMAALYQETLDAKTLLLILDNGRDEAQVRPLLPRNPECSAIVTSRHHLAGLTVSHDSAHIHLGRLSTAEANALLAKLLFTGGVSADREQLSELSARCAHLPLALRIAAAAFLADGSTTSVGEFAARLRSESLSDLSPSPTDPSTAVRTVMDVSYERLGPELRRALLLVATHPGSDHDVGAAAALLGSTRTSDVAATMRQLHELSLLEDVTDGPTARHRMHDLLVEYAHRHDDLADADPNAAGQRLRDHYLHTALAACNVLYPFDADRRPVLDETQVYVPRFTTAGQATTWLDAERANLVSVAVRAAEAGCADYIGAAAVTLYRYLDTGCHWQEAIRLHTAAFRHAAGPDRGRAANQLAITYVNLGDYAQARDFARHAIAVARAEGRVVDQSMAVATLARVYLGLNRYERAASLFRHNLRLAEEAGHLTYVAWSLSNLGVATLRSELDKTMTVEYFRRAADLCVELDATAGLTVALGNLALALEYRGEITEALEYSRRALTIADESQDVQQQVRLLCNMAKQLSGVGDHTAALAHVDDAVRRARRLTLDILECEAVNVHAATLASSGRLLDARAPAETALAMAVELDDRIEQAIAHQTLGTVAHHVAEHDTGVYHHDRAVRLATEARECNVLVEALDAVGNATATTDPDRARRHWERVLPMLREMNPTRADALAARLTAL